MRAVCAICSAMNRRRFLRFLSIPLAFSGTAAAWASWRAGRNPYYSGPVTDHFDGVQFHSPGGSPLQGIGRLLQWHLAGGKESWPETYPAPRQVKPAPRITGSKFAVTFVGHASYLLQTGGLNILIDPVWSERAGPMNLLGPKRVTPAGIRFDDLPDIDAVLITHNHYDHLDIATLQRLNTRHHPRFITALGNDTIIRSAAPDARAEAFDWGRHAQLSDTVSVHLEPCNHWSARGLLDRRMALWAAFIIKTPAGNIYHIGDTGFGDGLVFRAAREKHGPFRLAHIPIGAYEPRWFMSEQHVNPEEAVAIFQASGAAAAIGHHWGAFRLADEGIERPLEALRSALEKSGIDPQRFRGFRPGEVFEAA